MHKMTANMGAAFNRPTCGYYDDSTKHGGPDPNPEQRENGKPRNRRSDDEDRLQGYTDHCGTKFDVHNAVVQAECCREVPSFLTQFSDECEPLMRVPLPPVPKSSSGDRSKYNRLSNDPALKWKQIMTGCRKWAERFIGNCSGQRKNNLIKKRTKNVLTKVHTKLGF